MFTCFYVIYLLHLYLIIKLINMKTRFLLPACFKRIGWIIMIPSATLGLLLLFNILEFGFLDNAKVFALYSEEIFGKDRFMTVITNNIADEILGILIIIGGIMVAFSREKREDEFIARIRLESLVWATYINYAVLLFCILFFYGSGFLYIMIFNMFTILIIFIARFHFLMYRSEKSLRHEK